MTVVSEGDCSCKLQDGNWCLTYEQNSEVVVLPKRVAGHIPTVLLGIAPTWRPVIKNLLKITIPPSIVTITDNCFVHCNRLSEVIFEAGSQLREIGCSAFKETGLKSISLPKMLEIIGDQCFKGCKHLTDVNFDPCSRLMRIGDDAFSSCMIKALTLPRSIEHIGDKCFSECRSMRQFSFDAPSSIKSIGAGAFSCTNVKEFFVPKTVKTIGEACFKSCSSMSSITFEKGGQLEVLETDLLFNAGIKSIVVPKSVRIINNQCFHGCRSCTDISFEPGSLLRIIRRDAFAYTKITKFVFPRYVDIGCSSSDAPDDSGRCGCYFTNCKLLETIQITSKTYYDKSTNTYQIHNWKDVRINGLGDSSRYSTRYPEKLKCIIVPGRELVAKMSDGPWKVIYEEPKVTASEENEPDMEEDEEEEIPILVSDYRKRGTSDNTKKEVPQKRDIDVDHIRGLFKQQIGNINTIKAAAEQPLSQSATQAHKQGQHDESEDDVVRPFVFGIMGGEASSSGESERNLPARCTARDPASEFEQEQPLGQCQHDELEDDVVRPFAFDLPLVESDGYVISDMSESEASSSDESEREPPTHSTVRDPASEFEQEPPAHSTVHDPASEFEREPPAHSTVRDPASEFEQEPPAHSTVRDPASEFEQEQPLEQGQNGASEDAMDLGANILEREENPVDHFQQEPELTGKALIIQEKVEKRKRVLQRLTAGKTGQSDYIDNIDDYERDDEKIIGRGANGKVFLYRKDDDLFAAKYVQSGAGSLQSAFDREFANLITVSHPCVVQLNGVVLPNASTRYDFVIIMEYVSGGNVWDAINSKPAWFNSTAKAIILYGIAAGMRFVHSKNIMHRDLKPQNVLLDEDHFPRLCDFGSSRPIDESSMTGLGVGTAWYIPPELFDMNSNYTNKIDVYSFGVMLLEIITESFALRRYPNHPIGIAQLGRFVCEGGRETIPDSVSDFGREMIEQCWHQSPEQRPSFEEICNVFRSYMTDLLPDVDMEEFLAFADAIDRS